MGPFDLYAQKYYPYARTSKQTMYGLFLHHFTKHDRRRDHGG